MFEETALHLALCMISILNWLLGLGLAVFPFCSVLCLPPPCSTNYVIILIAFSILANLLLSALFVSVFFWQWLLHFVILCYGFWVYWVHCGGTWLPVVDLHELPVAGWPVWPQKVMEFGLAGDRDECVWVCA